MSLPVQAPTLFSDLNIDPVDGAETLKLLGVDPAYLIDPVLLQRVRDIVGFFKTRDDKRYQIAKLMSKSPGSPVVSVWNWVQMETERINIIKKLDASIFDESVRDELASGYLSSDSIENIESGLDAWEGSFAREAQDPDERIGEIRESINRIKEIKHAS